MLLNFPFLFILKLMKNILIVQSRINPDAHMAERAEYVRAIGNRAQVNFISSLDETVPWHAPEKMLEGYQGVIFGGSGDFDFDGGRAEDDEARLVSRRIVKRVESLVLYILEHDFPMLGVCYGHQIVAEVLGVPVLHDVSQMKRGTFEVEVTEAGKIDIIFSDTPDVFCAQYGHKDSVSAVPPGAVLLGQSLQCRASIFRYGAHVYTTQFHPELTHEDLARRLQSSPGYLPEGVSVESLVRPSHEASTIIPKFVERVIP